MTTSIGERLRALRTRAGISSRELDRRAELGEGHSSMIETGRRENIERSTARALASVLNCRVGWLLEGEGSDADAFASDDSAAPAAESVDPRPSQAT